VTSSRTRPSTRSTTIVASDRASSTKSSKTRFKLVFGSDAEGTLRDRSSKSTTRRAGEILPGSGDWPLADSDAVMLGVDTSSTDCGHWVVSSVHRHVRVTDRSGRRDALLQQTRTATGTTEEPRKNRSRCSSRSLTSSRRLRSKRDTTRDRPATSNEKGDSRHWVRFGVDTVNPKGFQVVSTDPD